MKNKIKLYATLILIIFSLITACNPSDRVVDLPEGYQLVIEGTDDISIIGPHNIAPNITKYGYSPDFILVEQQPDKGVFVSKKAKELLDIFENVGNTPQDRWSSIDTNSLNIYKAFVKKGANINGESHTNVIIGFRMADSIISSSVYQRNLQIGKALYYIISLKADSLIGPLTKEEYEQKKKELNVPDNLQLWSADR